MGLQAIPASTAGRHHQLKLAHLRESARVTEARQPLGQAVAVGLTLSQILTLYITLMVYYYLDIMQRRLMRKCQQEAPDG